MSKYTKGVSPRYDSISSPGLLAKLNAIIEWEDSIFPPKKDESGNYMENREFLGNPPELKVGNTFLYDNQLISVEDENTLVLVLSETGANGLKRVWKDLIKPEMEIVFSDPPEEPLEVSKATVNEIPESWSHKAIHYDMMKLIRDRMIPGREEQFMDGEKVCAKVTLHSNILCYPISVYLSNWGYEYDPKDIESDEIDYITEELVCGLYNQFPRVAKKYENPYENMNEAQKQAKEITDQIISQLESGTESTEKSD
jgi:hypothetical protein